MVVLVLPAFNEAEAILPLLRRAKEFSQRKNTPLRVIVVDDGSKDGTAEAVRSFQGLSIELIQHEKNQGLSAALRTGLTAAVARCHDDDVIVTMDADDTHAPALISQMLDRIAEGYNIVIASRYVPNARIIGVSWLRALMSRVAGLLFRITFPIEGVSDYTCGFRAYEAGVLRAGFNKFGDALIDQPGFSCMVDLLLKLSTLNPVVVEVPLLLRYDRKPGASKMNVNRTVSQTLTLLVSRRLHMPAGKAA